MSQASVNLTNGARATSSMSTAKTPGACKSMNTNQQGTPEKFNTSAHQNQGGPRRSPGLESHKQAGKRTARTSMKTGSPPRDLRRTKDITAWTKRVIKVAKVRRMHSSTTTGWIPTKSTSTPERWAEEGKTKRPWSTRPCAKRPCTSRAMALDTPRLTTKN